MIILVHKVFIKTPIYNIIQLKYHNLITTLIKVIALFFLYPHAKGELRFLSILDIMLGKSYILVYLIMILFIRMKIWAS